MTQQIANILGVDNAQAEELKRDPGARTAEMSEACSASVNHLVSEIRLSLDYFMTEKNIQIDWVVGRYSRGWRRFLKTTLGFR